MCLHHSIRLRNRRFRVAIHFNSLYKLLYIAYSINSLFYQYIYAIITRNVDTLFTVLHREPDVLYMYTYLIQNTNIVFVIGHSNNHKIFIKSTFNQCKMLFRTSWLVNFLILSVQTRNFSLFIWWQICWKSTSAYAGDHRIVFQDLISVVTPNASISCFEYLFDHNIYYSINQIDGAPSHSFEARKNYNSISYFGVNHQPYQ